MNTTTMPGFTAEASVYRTGGFGKTTATLSQETLEGVQPAMRALDTVEGFQRAMRGPGGFWGCMVCIGACSLTQGDPVACYYICRELGPCLP